MKRIAIIALAALLSAAVLFACSANNGGGSDTSAKGTENTAASAEASVEITAVSGDSSAENTAGGSDAGPVEDPNTVVPGVAWEDLVPLTKEAGSADSESEDASGSVTGGDASDTAEATWFDLESGIELPIIPLP